ncbi:hypothetical protein V8G54_035918 [Vigna mungo]|uniref:Uncharacterized protein n=1 Tax=Vigna mungo TaxID=3915 RepID=A0AAQ3MHH5_VIGMU
MVESFDITAGVISVLTLLEEANGLSDFCSGDERLSSWKRFAEKFKLIVLLKLQVSESSACCDSDFLSALTILPIVELWSEPSSPKDLVDLGLGSKTKLVLGMVSFCPKIKVLLAISKAWSTAKFDGLKSVTLLTNLDLEATSEDLKVLLPGVGILSAENTETKTVPYGNSR